MTGFSGGAEVAIVGVVEMGSRSDFFCSAGVGGAMTSSALGLGTGVSSTVECFPVVHGGMARNSSKVKTRGLQHFQPARSATGLEGTARAASTKSS